MWFRKKDDPIEQEKRELAEAWSREELTSAERAELINRYMELDSHQLARESVQAQNGIGPKDLFNSGVTLGLALLTLNYERTDVIRSKVANFWLRRKQ